MDYINEVKDLLQNFSEYKKEVIVLKKVGSKYCKLEEKINFLEFCFTLLDTYQKELLFSVCINGISMRKYSDHSGLSRNFISKEKEKIIKQLARFFTVKYDSKNL